MLRALLLVFLVAGCKEKAPEPAKVETRAEPSPDPSPAARKAPEAQGSGSGSGSGSDEADKTEKPMTHQQRVRETVKKVGVDLKGDAAAIPRTRTGKTTQAKEPAPAPKP